MIRRLMQRLSADWLGRAELLLLILVIWLTGVQIRGELAAIRIHQEQTIELLGGQVSELSLRAHEVSDLLRTIERRQRETQAMLEGFLEQIR